MKSGKFVCLCVCAAVCLIAALACATSAPAQTFERAEVRGTVFDQQHSGVPKAKITIFNASTGYKRETSSNPDGTYVLSDIPPGTYELKAEAENLAPIVIKDLIVNIGASLNLDLTLPVKGQATTITVSATAAPVDTSTAGVSQLINQRNLENLPLAGRDYRDLAQLSSTAQTTPGLRAALRLGGQQGDYAQLVIDGQDSYNNFFGEFFGSLETRNFSIPLDSVQEFQVVNNGFAPEFGRATGGLVNVVTKSGTNDWHGTFHYNALSGSFSPNDALKQPSNIDLRQQYGGTLGFPIHKDRQFLFLGFDMQRQHGPLTTQPCTPGPGSGQATCIQALTSMGTGPVFNATCTGRAGTTNPCAPGQVPLPTNAPAGSLLPAGCKTPAAGDSVLKDCFGVNNLAGFLGSHNQFQNFNTVLGHYDYQFSPANHFSIRGYFTRNHTNGFTGGRGQNTIQDTFSNTENFINQGVSGVFGLNTVLGKKVNEIRVSLNGETRKRHSNAPGVPQIVIDDPIGNGLSTTLGQKFFLPINGDGAKLQVADNFETTWGKHDFKFGGDVASFADRKDRFIGWSAGEFDFGSLSAFNSGMGAFFVQGFGVNGQPLFQAGTLFPAYQNGIGLYWQDKWQIAPRVIVTYGLRWDATLNPQPQTPNRGNQVYVGVGLPGSGTREVSVPQRMPNDYEQWGPRVGLAWNVGGSEHPTVIRGAWGLYYAQTPPIFFGTAGGGKTGTCFGCGGGAKAGFPYILPSNQPPAGTVGSVASPPGPLAEPDFRNPRVSNLTGGVEYTLMRDVVLSATYTYTHSWRLRTGGFDSAVWARNFVPAGACPGAGCDSFGRTILKEDPANLGSALAFDPTISQSLDQLGSYSRANYNALVFNVTKRFSNHFQLFGNYTWSQNKDNATSERDSDSFYGPQDPFNLNLDYGRNGLDVTHQFKAAGVYDFPWGFTVSGIMIARSGLPFPVYINADINGDGVKNQGHINDRPSVQLGSGTPFLLGRYPLSQPDFFNWDVRLQKDVPLHERYHVQLQADFFNLTNRGNLYSNPEVASASTIPYSSHCTARAPGSGAVGMICTPLTAIPTPLTAPFNTLRAVNQISPGNNPFQFQAGFKFIF